MKNGKNCFFALLATMAVFACRAGETGEDHEHEHDHPKGTEIHVSVAAQKLIGIRTERLARRDVQSTLVLRGRLEQSPTGLTAVAAPVGGRVAFKVRPFASVAAGDVLFTVASSEIKARREELAVLSRRLENYTVSGAKNASLAAELETKKRALLALLDGVEETNGVVRVRASRAGVVRSLDVVDGSRVDVNAQIVTLVDSTDLRLKARVAAADLQRLSDGLTVRAGDAIGRLHLPTDEADVVYMIFDKPLAKGRVGAFLSVVCTTDSTAAPVLCVPNEAIVQMGVTPTIFVRVEGEEDAFVALTVEPGIRDSAWTEVRNLADDDLEVVVRGQYELKLALANQQGGGRKTGHFHADGVFHEADEH